MLSLSISGRLSSKQPGSASSDAPSSALSTGIWLEVVGGVWGLGKLSGGFWEATTGFDTDRFKGSCSSFCVSRGGFSVDRVCWFKLRTQYRDISVSTHRVSYLDDQTSFSLADFRLPNAWKLLVAGTCSWIAYGGYHCTFQCIGRCTFWSAWELLGNARTMFEDVCRVSGVVIKMSEMFPSISIDLRNTYTKIS